MDTPVTGQIIERIKSLPKHDANTIANTAEQLSLLHAVIQVPFTDVDVATLTRDRCVTELEAIRDMTLKELTDRPGIEEKLARWYGSSPTMAQRQVWIAYVKESRMKQLARAFELVNRLRDDVPEAWDEINELYYDD